MRTDKINWPAALFILGYHGFLLIALPLYFCYFIPSRALIALSAGLVFICGLAITSGYHRLYSHATYKTHWAIESIFLFFSTLATQGSALRWAYDHRMHHAFVDTDKDPYTVKKGFMHAHLYWMFKQSNPIDAKVVADLIKNSLLRFQDKYYVFCMLGSNTLVFILVGWMLNDYLGAFVFAWWARLLVSHHTTWCINSLAHYWGSKNYSDEHTAVDNYIISLITYGEGYHNYHHSFAQDYRNGVRWFHYDPGKWLIWMLGKVGWARDLKTVNDLRIKRQLVKEHTHKLLEALKNSMDMVLKEKVTLLSKMLIEKLTSLQALYDRCKQIPKNETSTLREQIRASKREWKETWRDWKRLVKNVQKDYPIQH